MMKFQWVAGIFVLAIGLATAVLAADDAKAPASSLIERGKYIANNTSGCNDCHTPMNEKGEPIVEKQLQGSVLFFKPTVPIPNWVESAPDITNLKGWTDEDLVKFLMTGIQPNGQPANPPMPPFRFNKEDAQALTAYIRSLGKKKNVKEAELKPE